MSDKAKIRHRVISVEAGVVDINWENAHDCTVETGSLTGTVISKAMRGEQPSEVQGTADTEWNEIIKVTIVQNPALTDGQQKSLSEITP